MNDEEMSSAEINAQSVPTNLHQDWSETTFPTSAKTVFLWAALMFSGIFVLCFYVYWTSEKPTPVSPENAKSKKRAAVEENVAALSADGEGDEEE